jgi:hypothetical protein
MNEVLRFNLNEPVEIRFQLEIEGALATINSIRFVILKDKLRLSFVGDYRDKNATFRFSDLEKFLDSGVYQCELEVYVGSQYFVPFVGHVELVQPVLIKAMPVISDSSTKITAIVEPNIVAKSVKIEKTESQPKLNKNLHKKLYKGMYIQSLDEAYNDRRRR